MKTSSMGPVHGGQSLLGVTEVAFHPVLEVDFTVTHNAYISRISQLSVR
jgi:hypothetical protein